MKQIVGATCDLVWLCMRRDLGLDEIADGAPGACLERAREVIHDDGTNRSHRHVARRVILHFEARLLLGVILAELLQLAYVCVT